MQMFGTRVQLLILRNIILAFPKNKRKTRYLSKTIGMRLRVFKYIVSEEKNACVCVLAETKSRKIRRKRKKKQLRGAKATPLWQLHRARSRPNRIIIENVVIYICFRIRYTSCVRRRNSWTLERKRQKLLLHASMLVRLLLKYTVEVYTRTQHSIGPICGPYRRDRIYIHPKQKKPFTYFHKTLLYFIRGMFFFFFFLLILFIALEK